MAFISANGVAEDEVGGTQWLLAARLAHSGPAAAMKVPALVVPPAPPSAPDMSAPPPPPPPQAARVRPNKQAGHQENRGAQRRWAMARRKLQRGGCMVGESRDGRTPRLRKLGGKALSSAGTKISADNALTTIDMTIRMPNQICT